MLGKRSTFSPLERVIKSKVGVFHEPGFLLIRGSVDQFKEARVPIFYQS
jgi:hypothetical protein